MPDWWTNDFSNTGVAPRVPPASSPACFAVVLFEYRFFVNHRWSWDLLAVAVTFVAIKLALMAWYYVNS